MSHSTIPLSRLQRLNQRGERKGEYVLYWMQQAQRAQCNPALEYAIQAANDANQPVLAGFGLMDNYPDANERHYAFMLEGLHETQIDLRRRGVQLVIQLGSPPQVALTLGENASMIVCDRGYLRHQAQWRDALAKQAECAVIQVETDVIVPVESISGKHEIAARTIRPKIQKQLDAYLKPLTATRVKQDSLALDSDRFAGLDRAKTSFDPERTLAGLKIDRDVPRSPYFKGGASNAHVLLKNFLLKKLDRYTDERNDPAEDIGSHMSPYLHFGQISPLEIALAIRRQGFGKASESYLEELIVRRELSMNFAHFHPEYDRFTCIPAWAKKTLHEHRHDRREHEYGLADLDHAETHDPYWNAAMREMKVTGYMHNYMRMYWGKKIIEWSSAPEQAFSNALELNNKYFLDGRDPNSYANVAWLFGLHDRPFPERPIFGKVRSMTAGGLERKFDIARYVQRIAKLD